VIDEPRQRLEEGALRGFGRDLIPRVLAGLVRGHLHELDGDLLAAGAPYADAAHRATDVAERDHLIRQAARARAAALAH
jgi:hypothetical protein